MYLNYHYKMAIKNDLIKKFHYKNPMQLPKIKRIILKSSLNDTTQTQRKLLIYRLALENISGQKAKTIASKKSVANFKLKKGLPISCKVTLRNNKLNKFLHKTIIIFFTKLKEFNGLKLTKKQKTNSCNFGIKNIQNFNEIETQYNKFTKSFGLDLTIKTTTKEKKVQKILFTGYQIPVKK